MQTVDDPNCTHCLTEIILTVQIVCEMWSSHCILGCYNMVSQKTNL